MFSNFLCINLSIFVVEFRF